ncbi:MAG: LppX_LprAFG lipoprotein [Candidatus Dormibacteria bacterium]
MGGTVRRRLALAAVAVTAMTACGNSVPPLSAATLLRDAKQSIDTATSVHFSLTSANVSGGGPLLTGGHGDARRPDGFSGVLTVVVDGLPVNVDVVSVGGVFYARTPLSGGSYDRTDPSTYGFGDPAKLLDPNSGLSSLLSICSNAASAPADKLNGEDLAEVTCTIPGAAVAALLTSADPSQPVRATVGVDASTHQLRRVTLSGPFFSATQTSTFTVVLSHYGENVTVTPPA